MTSSRLFRRAAALALGFASLGASAPAFASAASGLLYERALMSAADARCNLFSPDVGRALSAARAQARNAALRAGDAPASVEATELRAMARASSVGCASPGLALAADRLRTAYADYAKIQVMTFRGSRAAWRAERPYAGYPGARWSLLQPALGQGGWVLFGIEGGQVSVLDARRGAQPAAAVRLVLRDPARLAEPYVDGRAGDLAAQVPPRSASQVFFASGRNPVTTRVLLPAGASRGFAYSLPSRALGALSRLDPREIATVEIVYPGAGGDRVQSAWIEVGDLAAARAFLAIGATRVAQR